MPIHDWSRVENSVYHHFHQRWTISICDSLNSGLLPSTYSALVEQHAAGLVPDVLAVERQNGAPSPGVKGGVLVAEPPKTRLILESKLNLLHLRANRIAIRRRMGQVVCIIEIVSPGNKDSRAALRSFVDKTREFLEAGVNVLIIDPFPPTARDPHGIHKAIWDEIEGDEAFELPVHQPLTLAAYVAGNITVGRSIRAYIETIGVGTTLPDMPAYLDPDYYVPVPLENTYQATWATCPADMRFLVEHGKLPGE
jgi:hypothetical protein